MTDRRGPRGPDFIEFLQGDTANQYAVPGGTIDDAYHNWRSSRNLPVQVEAPANPWPEAPPEGAWGEGPLPAPPPPRRRGPNRPQPAPQYELEDEDVLDSVVSWRFVQPYIIYKGKKGSNKTRRFEGTRVKISWDNNMPDEYREIPALMGTPSERNKVRVFLSSISRTKRNNIIADYRDLMSQYGIE